MHPDRSGTIGSIVFVIIVAMLAACSVEESAPPYIGSVTVYGPPPASDASVAYLEIHNPGNQAITLSGVSSPQFGLVEIHETRTDKGVARMRQLDSLTIGAGKQAIFATGGRHLMLLQPRVRMEIDTPLTLKFQFDDGNSIIVDTVLQSRTVR